MSRAIVAGCHLGPDDRSLLVLPLFHCNGLVVGTIAPLRAGGDVHVADRFSPDTFWKQVSRAKATYFSAVPTMYSLLVDRGPTHTTSRVAVRGVRAAPMPAGLIAAFESLYAVPLIEGYGLSECTVAATLNLPTRRASPEQSDAPCPVSRSRSTAPTDRRGARCHREVLIGGRTVMQGYLGLPETTAATIRGGWLHSGDLGVLDDDGYLTLVGRSKDMIIRGGENIAPGEVENVIETHPDVLSRSPSSDERIRCTARSPVAHVVPRAGHTIDTTP